MKDLDAFVSTVKQMATAAEEGDREARQHLRDELWSLSKSERIEVANKLEDGKSVSVVRGADNTVVSLTFSPSISQRVFGYFGTRTVHAVEITSPVTENINSSSGSYSQLRQEYERLPLSVRQMLVDKRFVVAIAETMSKAQPDREKESNFNPLFGGKSEPDRFAAQSIASEHRIVLAERSKASDGQYHANAIGPLLREQVGAAVERYMGSGQLSKSEAFRGALLKDLEQMPQEIRNRYHRYIVPAQDGPAALFAIEFALLTRSTNGDLALEREGEIHRYFKQTGAVVRELLGADLSEQQQCLNSLEKDAEMITAPLHLSAADSIEAMARQALSGIAKGQTGDQNSFKPVAATLGKLDYRQRIKLAERLSWILGTSTDNGPGLKIERDVIGSIRSMSFIPVGLGDGQENIQAVEILSPLVENYNASDEFFRRVVAEVERLPPKVSDYLYAHRWVIASAHTMLEGAPDLDRRYEQPPTGLGCLSRDCAAGIELPDERRILIPEHSKSANGKWSSNKSAVEQVVRHEVGHVMDHAFGQISHNQEFVDAYQKDLAGMPQAVRAKVAYQTQDGWKGPEEMFAELFGIILRRDDKVLKDFEGHWLLHYYMRRTEQVIIDKLGDRLKR